MSEEEGFLARWSRRKRAAPEASPPEPPAAEAPGLPPEEPDLAAEDLALLPRPEEITAETDVTGFLRGGVPASLRNAALRRAWLLDPAIRDRVGDALDYAWDYNVPGGAPGFGPIEPGTDVAGAVARMFSRSPERPAPDRPEPASAPDLPPEAGPPPAPARPDPVPSLEPSSEAVPPEAALPVEAEGAGGPAEASVAPSAAREAREEGAASPIPALRRRHGGALPL